MPKFIYVFCERDRDELASCGYELLHENREQGLYVFLNQQTKKFSDACLSYVETDNLTF